MSHIYKPLRDRVLVRRHDAVATTPGGLHLPQSAQNNQRGIVVAIGSGQYTQAGRRLKLDVEVGDEVVLQKSAGGPACEVDVDGEKLIVVHEHEIMLKEVRAKPGKRATVVQRGNVVGGDMAGGDVVKTAESKPLDIPHKSDASAGLY